MKPEDEAFVIPSKKQKVFLSPTIGVRLEIFLCGFRSQIDLGFARPLSLTGLQIFDQRKNQGLRDFFGMANQPSGVFFVVMVG